MSHHHASDSAPTCDNKAKRLRLRNAFAIAIAIGAIGAMLRTNCFPDVNTDIARFLMALSVGMLVVILHHWLGSSRHETATAKTDQPARPGFNPDFTEPAHLPLNIDSNQPFPLDGIEEGPRKGGVINLKNGTKLRNDNPTGTSQP
jgi:hypothetical protein